MHFSFLQWVQNLPLCFIIQPANLLGMTPTKYQKLREAAKAVSIEAILAAVGHSPAKNSTNGDVWYNSPFREDSSPSFHVLNRTNQWFDFGEGMERPADSITLAMKLTGKPFTEACEWLVGLSGRVVAAPPIQRTPRAAIGQMEASKQATNDNLAESGHILETVYEFSTWTGRGRNREFTAQARYLANRGLKPEICSPYVATIKFSPAHKKTAKWYAVGFPNNGGGYEVRAQFGQTHFKSCVGPRDITTIFAQVSKSEPPPTRLHVFEGFPDFLTFLHLKPDIAPKRENFLILNGTGMITRALSVIEAGIGEYGTKFNPLILWTQNDAAGEILTNHFLKKGTALGMSVNSMNYFYANYKDLNEQWQSNQGQKLINRITS